MGSDSLFAECRDGFEAEEVGCVARGLEEDRSQRGCEWEGDALICDCGKDWIRLRMEQKKRDQSQTSRDSY